MSGKTFKCLIAAIFWVVCVSIYAALCYVSYELLLFMKDMPYGLVAVAIFSGTIVAIIAAIVLESMFYGEIIRTYCSCQKSINI